MCLVWYSNISNTDLAWSDFFNRCVVSYCCPRPVSFTGRPPLSTCNGRALSRLESGIGTHCLASEQYKLLEHLSLYRRLSFYRYLFTARITVKTKHRIVICLQSCLNSTLKNFRPGINKPSDVCSTLCLLLLRVTSLIK